MAVFHWKKSLFPFPFIHQNDFKCTGTLSVATFCNFDPMTITVKDLSKLSSAASRLIEVIGNKRVWLFYGEMGGGKTTLIKAICEALDIDDQASSPTFSIVNEYASPQGPVYHFDFYRIRSEQEALDLGYEEYFYSGHYCFVEWPELIPNLLPDDAAVIHIAVTEDGAREIRVDTSAE